MKITGTGPIRTPAEAARLRKKQDAKGAKFAEQIDSGGRDSAAPASGSTGPSPVDALLAIQEVGDATHGRSAGLRRAERMLDSLEDIRVGLLDGAIPRERLSDLVETVRTRRNATEDPRLNAILDEIELRASVELAKLEQYP